MPEPTAPFWTYAPIRARRQQARERYIAVTDAALDAANRGDALGMLHAREGLRALAETERERQRRDQGRRAVGERAAQLLEERRERDRPGGLGGLLAGVGQRAVDPIVSVLDQLDRLHQAGIGAATGETPAASVRQAVRGYRREEVYDPQQIGFVRQLPEGRLRAAAGRVAEEVVDPTNIAIVARGPALAARLTGAAARGGAVGRVAGVARGFVQPIVSSPNAAVRLAGEAGVSLAAREASEAAGELLPEETPAAVRTATQIGAGFAGGGAAIGALGVGQRAARVLAERTAATRGEVARGMRLGAQAPMALLGARIGPDDLEALAKEASAATGEPLPATLAEDITRATAAARRNPKSGHPDLVAAATDLINWRGAVGPEGRLALPAARRGAGTRTPQQVAEQGRTAADTRAMRAAETEAVRRMTEQQARRLLGKLPEEELQRMAAPGGEQMTRLLLHNTFDTQRVRGGKVTGFKESRSATFTGPRIARGEFDALPQMELNMRAEGRDPFARRATAPATSARATVQEPATAAVPPSVAAEPPQPVMRASEQPAPVGAVEPVRTSEQERAALRLAVREQYGPGSHVAVRLATNRVEQSGRFLVTGKDAAGRVIRMQVPDEATFRWMANPDAPDPRSGLVMEPATAATAPPSAAPEPEVPEPPQTLGAAPEVAVQEPPLPAPPVPPPPVRGAPPAPPGGAPPRPPEGPPAVPPGGAPPLPPAAAGGAGGRPPQPERGTSGLDAVIARVDQTLLKPGRLGEAVLAHPLIRRGVSLLNPSVAQDRKLFVAENARVRLRAQLETRWGEQLHSAASRLQAAFEAEPPRYTGDIDYPGGGTAWDMAQRPSQYEGITPAHREALEQWRATTTAQAESAVSEYNVDMRMFHPADPEAVYMPNVDVTEEMLEALDITPEQAAAFGRRGARFYENGYERWKAHRGSDREFTPLTDLNTLAEGITRNMAGAAAQQAFRRASGGKTLVELSEELHPGLREQRNRATAALGGLRARIETAEGQLSRFEDLSARLGREGRAIEERAARLRGREVPPEAGPEIAALNGQAVELAARAAALERLQRTLGESRLAGADMRLEGLRSEARAAQQQLQRLRRAYEAQDLRPYVLNRRTFLYHTVEESRQIDEMLRPVPEDALQTVGDELRAVVLTLDGSVATLHGGLGAMMDGPTLLPKIARDMLATGRDPEALRRFVAQHADAAEDFAFDTGYRLGGGPTPEFRQPRGVERLPLIGERLRNFNDAAWRAVEKRLFEAYMHDRAYLEATGLPREVAGYEAAHTLSLIVPRMLPADTGRSAARAARERLALISPSFAYAPTTLLKEATSALVKLGVSQVGTKQAWMELLPRERLSLMRLWNLGSTVMAISAVSALVSAPFNNESPARALAEVVDPRSGRFA